VFASAYVMTHMSFKRARAEPENRAFFNRIAPATWRDFKWAYLVVGSLTGTGIISQWFATTNLVPLVAILLANGMLMAQIYFARRLWHVILNTSED